MIQGRPAPGAVAPRARTHGKRTLAHRKRSARPVDLGRRLRTGPLATPKRRRRPASQSDGKRPARAGRQSQQLVPQLAERPPGSPVQPAFDARSTQAAITDGSRFGGRPGGEQEGAPALCRRVGRSSLSDVDDDRGGRRLELPGEPARRLPASIGTSIEHNAALELIDDLLGQRPELERPPVHLRTFMTQRGHRLPSDIGCHATARLARYVPWITSSAPRARCDRSKQTRGQLAGAAQSAPRATALRHPIAAATRDELTAHADGSPVSTAKTRES